MRTQMLNSCLGNKTLLCETELLVILKSKQSLGKIKNTNNSQLMKCLFFSTRICNLVHK